MTLGMATLNATSLQVRKRSLAQPMVDFRFLMPKATETPGAQHGFSSRLKGGGQLSTLLPDRPMVSAQVSIYKARRPANGRISKSAQIDLRRHKSPSLCKIRAFLIFPCKMSTENATKHRKKRENKTTKIFRLRRCFYDAVNCAFKKSSHIPFPRPIAVRPNARDQVK